MPFTAIQNTAGKVVPFRHRMRGEPGAEVAVDRRVHTLFLEECLKLPELKGDAYRVLANIVSHIFMGQGKAAPPQLEGFAFAKQETMAGELELSVATYERAMRRVKASGVVVLARRYGRSGLISLRWPRLHDSLKSEGIDSLRSEGSYPTDLPTGAAQAELPLGQVLPFARSAPLTSPSNGAAITPAASAATAAIFVNRPGEIPASAVGIDQAASREVAAGRPAARRRRAGAADPQQGGLFEVRGIDLPSQVRQAVEEAR